MGTPSFCALINGRNNREWVLCRLGYTSCYSTSVHYWCEVIYVFTGAKN